MMAVRTWEKAGYYWVGVFAKLGRPRSESILPQPENNPLSRPSFVAVIQSADLRQFNR